MKVLFLPSNVASLQAITAEALNKIEGIEAVAITSEMNKYQGVNKSIVYIPNQYSSYNPFKFIRNKFLYAKEIKKWIEWADVIHYVWGPAFKDGRDLKWAKQMNKPVFIEWLGSDIRNPELLFKINPFYKKVFYNGYEYCKREASSYKITVQQMFHSINAIPTLSPEMSIFLIKSLFPNYKSLMQRLNVKDFEPNYPSKFNKKPLVIHSPSAKICKGSDLIIPIIEELKKSYDFDFVLLHNMPRAEVLELMSKADIFLDQIICGGHGMATCEAMALGKPVMCYIMPEVFYAGLQEDCPIINTNPDNLKEQLVRLITDSNLRNELGLKARQYAEKHHDADVISLELINMYKSELAKK